MSNKKRKRTNNKFNNGIVTIIHIKGYDFEEPLVRSGSELRKLYHRLKNTRSDVS